MKVTVMTELRVHYWPATPHLRELKFFVNSECVLSVFYGADELLKIKNTIGDALNQIAITSRPENESNS